jgi:glucose uptake protein
MYQPQAYLVVLIFMVTSMLCWGSWANTRKLTQGYPFSLFYWDYVIGIVVGSLAWGATLGSLHGGPTAFLANLRGAAIDLAGMAVAFPVGIGLALIVGVVLNYAIQPRGNPALIFGGVALVGVAIVLDALAYRRREGVSKVAPRAVVLSIASGVLMGLFYPFVARSTMGHAALGPYGVAFVFACGVGLCSLPVNAWLMRHSLTGEAPVSFGEYAQARAGWHGWGVVGGVIWCTGAVASFVASQANAVGPAVSYAIGQGATMISAAWGVLIWREFAAAPAESRRLIPFMFLCFIVGLGAIACAPIWIW